MRYIDYNVEQAIRKFQIDLKEFAELLEENNILTNEAYLNYEHTLQKGLKMKKLIKEYKKTNVVDWINGLLISILITTFFIICVYQY